ncbi:MAG: methyltransferase domain-containing protein [Candidatus Thermoplasmatota archaeon]|nr:methyltransferase domain-containing protein [Candidatus Thermoplasmatota archaeon]
MVKVKGIEELEKTIAELKEISSPRICAPFADYLKCHEKRFIATANFLEGTIDGNSRILEVGAMPYFLTCILERTFGCKIETIGSETCDMEKEKLPYPDEIFDLVIMAEVLEHFRSDPAFALKECHRILKKDGILFVTTPNAQSLVDAAAKVLIARNPNSMYESSGEHYVGFKHHHEYTLPELRRLLEEHNFHVDRLTTKNIYGPAKHIPSFWRFGQTTMVMVRKFGENVITRSDWLYDPVSKLMESDTNYALELGKFLTEFLKRAGREKEIKTWKRYMKNTGRE